MSCALKILHTADWHLGHQLHGYSRIHEHQAFLDWLLEQLDIQQVDVLCVSGDLFDTANPSAASWRQLYQFLALAVQKCPGLQVILTAGNHDSPSKINAPGELLDSFDLRFIGHVQKDEQGRQELNRLLVPLKNRAGETHGWALAVPFLRSSDLVLDSSIEDGQQRWQQAIYDLYHQLGELADSVRQPNQMLMAMGHGHIRGGAVSENSERPVMMGGEHALPSEIFPEQCDYVALGHLHLGQQIKAEQAIYYSGSPLPLSLSERRYHHHVQLIGWDAGEVSIESLPVPRYADMLQLPEKPAPLADVLEQLRNLPVFTGSFEQSPYLEVQIQLDGPQAQLREQVVAALKDKNVRLTRIRTVYPQTAAEQQQFVGKDLDELTPNDVFELCYRQQYQQSPGSELLKAFTQVVHEVEEQL